MSQNDLSLYTINGAPIQKLVDHSKRRIRWRKNQQTAFCAFLARYRKSHATLDDDEEQLWQLCRDADALDGSCRDPAALPPHFWGTIRKRMLSSLRYHLDRLREEGKVRETYDAELKHDVIHWPEALVNEWTRPGGGWTGNEREGTSQAVVDPGSGSDPGFSQLPSEMDWDQSHIPTPQVQQLQRESPHLAAAASTVSSSFQQSRQQQQQRQHYRSTVDDPDTTTRHRENRHPPPNAPADDHTREIIEELRALQVEQQLQEEPDEAMSQEPESVVKTHSRRSERLRRYVPGNQRSNHMRANPASGEHHSHRPWTFDVPQPGPSHAGPSQYRPYEPESCRSEPSHSGLSWPCSSEAGPSQTKQSVASDGLGHGLSQSRHAPPQYQQERQPTLTSNIPGSSFRKDDDDKLQKEKIPNQSPFQQSSQPLHNGEGHIQSTSRSALGRQQRPPAANQHFAARQTGYNSPGPSRIDIPHQRPALPRNNFAKALSNHAYHLPLALWSKSPVINSELPYSQTTYQHDFSPTQTSHFSTTIGMSSALTPSSSWSSPIMSNRSMPLSAGIPPETHFQCPTRTKLGAGAGDAYVTATQSLEKQKAGSDANVTADGVVVATEAVANAVTGHTRGNIALTLRLVDRAADLGMMRLFKQLQQYPQQQQEQLLSSAGTSLNSPGFSAAATHGECEEEDDDEFEAEGARDWSYNWQRLLWKRATGSFT